MAQMNSMEISAAIMMEYYANMSDVDISDDDGTLSKPLQPAEEILRCVTILIDGRNEFFVHLLPDLVQTSPHIYER
ncbi:hypothetical protein T01_14529 [Trichinella spiralis]|uniref:Uncharacterized protein n=1 Tax=Trichinella spiralis TaxID=6334 RepID=A0A0V1B742_TRISP|nr:hypothetical protein T01_14529 [Trichinella spiralis]